MSEKYDDKSGNKQTGDGDGRTEAVLRILYNDQENHPERIVPLPTAVIERARTLVQGVDVDLDQPLPGRPPRAEQLATLACLRAHIQEGLQSGESENLDMEEIKRVARRLKINRTPGFP